MKAYLPSLSKYGQIVCVLDFIFKRVLDLLWLEVADRVRSFLWILTFSAKATNYTKQTDTALALSANFLLMHKCLFEKLFHKFITKIDCQKFNSYKQGKKTMHNHHLQCRQDLTLFSYMGIFMI